MQRSRPHPKVRARGHQPLVLEPGPACKLGGLAWLATPSWPALSPIAAIAPYTPKLNMPFLQKTIRNYKRRVAAKLAPAGAVRLQLAAAQMALQVTEAPGRSGIGAPGSPAAVAWRNRRRGDGWETAPWEAENAEKPPAAILCFFCAARI